MGLKKLVWWIMDRVWIWVWHKSKVKVLWLIIRALTMPSKQLKEAMALTCNLHICKKNLMYLYTCMQQVAEPHKGLTQLCGNQWLFPVSNISKIRITTQLTPSKKAASKLKLPTTTTSTTSKLSYQRWTTKRPQRRSQLTTPSQFSSKNKKLR